MICTLLCKYPKTKASPFNFALLLGLFLIVSGCGKKTPPVESAPATPAKAGVSIDQAADNQAPTAPAPDAPAPVVNDTAGPVPTTGASLNAEARKQRNLQWLKILKTGSAQQKQQVQDQLTHLSSDELTELTALYEKQEKIR